MEAKTIKCPVCGKEDVEEFDICSTCNWENDLIQLDEPDYKGGANKMSLNEAKIAYKEGKPIR